ncbi:hypothetical protein ACNKHT_15505 [Shigella flexneri]
MGITGAKLPPRGVARIAVADTACSAKNLDYSAANHRQIGNRPMLVLTTALIAPPNPPQFEPWRQEIGVRPGGYVQQQQHGRRSGAFNRHRRAHGGDGASNAPRTIVRALIAVRDVFADAATFICPYSTSYP